MVVGVAVGCFVLHRGEAQIDYIILYNRNAEGLLRTTSGKRPRERERERGADKASGKQNGGNTLFVLSCRGDM